MTSGRIRPGGRGWVVRGTLAGIAGASALALWFLILDIAAGDPLSTAVFLAASLLGAEEAAVTTEAVVLYAIVHYATFVVAGLSVAWILPRVARVPKLLLGAVLGVALFDWILYTSLYFTGVDVVSALGWPKMLVGALLAGVSLVGSLSAQDQPGRGWWRRTGEARIVRRGVRAGAFGAAATLLWLLLADLARGRLLLLQGALGSALLFGADDAAAVRVGVATVGGHALVHSFAFLGVGWLASATLARERNFSPPVLGGLLLFAVFEALSLGWIGVAAPFLLDGANGWIVTGANLLGAGAMAYLLRGRPGSKEPVDGSG